VTIKKSVEREAWRSDKYQPASVLFNRGEISSGVNLESCVVKTHLLRIIQLFVDFSPMRDPHNAYQPH
jgi:hypothetical protein